MWKPGKGVRPTPDELREYDQWVREKPETRWPKHDPAVYAMMGFRSSNPNIEGQQSLPVSGEGIDPPPFTPLRRWEDIPTEKQGNRITQQSVQERELNRHGLRMSHIENRVAGLLDRALERARGGTPEGLYFYSESERRKVGAAARRQEVPFETMAGMTAATSPQVAWMSGDRDVNIGIAEDVAEYRRRGLHMREGAPDIPDTDTGLADKKRKAVEIYETSGGKGDLTPHDVFKDGPKVKSFFQNLVHPHNPRGRTTVDVHMVQAGTGIPSERDRKTFIDRKGNYEMMDVAIRRAGAPRGLSGPEAQAIAWYQQKHENEQGMTGRGTHGRTMAKMWSANAGSREVSGQLDIFGGEVAHSWKPDTRLYEPRAMDRTPLNVDQFKGQREGKPL